MLKTNDIIGSRIKAHNDINPSYRVKTLKRLLGSFVPNQILDVGCGLGFTTRELKRVFPSAQVTGIDISTDAIFFAQKSIGSVKQWQLVLYLCLSINSYVRT